MDEGRNKLSLQRDECISDRVETKACGGGEGDDDDVCPCVFV